MQEGEELPKMLISWFQGQSLITMISVDIVKRGFVFEEWRSVPEVTTEGRMGTMGWVIKGGTCRKSQLLQPDIQGTGFLVLCGTVLQQ